MAKGFKQTFITRLTDVWANDRDGVGSIRIEGNKVYKYVQIMNSATVAGAAGDMVVYFAATGYGNSRVCVRAADGDATVPFAAGILLAAVAGVAAVAEYAWIQIKGPATLSTAVTGAAAGKVFKASTSDKTFAVTTAATDNVAGISMNATTGVCLTCPF
jgi:hypothetical protein